MTVNGDASTPLRSCRVLLLKAADDAYAAALTSQQQCEAAAFEPYFADVLTFEYVNTQALHNALMHLERYSALLVTSPRGAIAIANAVQALQHTDENAYADALTRLRALRIFSVGRATSRELDVLGVTCFGDECGSADALTVYLQQDGVLPAESNSKPVLFACGEKRSDVLPEHFHARGVALEQLVVYRSCPVADVQLPQACGVPHWVAFFSPSGLRAMKDMALPWASIRKAAIGACPVRSADECECEGRGQQTRLTWSCEQARRRLLRCTSTRSRRAKRTGRRT